MKMKLFVLLSMLSLLGNGKVFADEEEAMPPPDQTFWQTLVMIGIAFLFFYVILWRPEQKKRKELENQRTALKKGDRVVAMGTIGTVLRVGENTVIVKMYDGAKLEFYKAAITDILPEDEGKKVDLNSEE
ncbi:MAG: preprotein translocase subunit YajC [Candidatus Protochlamydia sp.]|nr:preprotein translocase subunit YajC [Candidatus Protochlamydia sp.]